MRWGVLYEIEECCIGGEAYVCMRWCLISEVATLDHGNTASVGGGDNYSPID